MLQDSRTAERIGVADFNYVFNFSLSAFVKALAWVTDEQTDK